MSDPETKFAKSLGWTNGERIARYAMIIDHGKVVYAEKEPGRDVTVRVVHGKPILVSDADVLIIGFRSRCCFGKTVIHGKYSQPQSIDLSTSCSPHPQPSCPLPICPMIHDPSHVPTVSETEKPRIFASINNPMP